MKEIHKQIEDFSDLYLHDLLSVEQRQEFRQHCQQCESCQAVFEQAQKRLATLKNLPDEEVPRAFLRQSISRAQNTIVWNRVEISYWSLFVAASVFFLLFCFFYRGSRPSPFDLMVYSQSQLSINSNASLRVVLVDRNRNQPLPDVPVEVSLVSEDNQAELLTSFVTDSAGTGTPVFRIPDWKEGTYELRISATTTQGKEELVRTVQLKRNWKIMLSTDKPVYQPGQTIRIRSLALRSFDSKPVVGTPTVFRVVDPKGNVILQQQKVTSRFGISSLNCELAHELVEGNYHIHCETGNSTSKKTVEVKSYTLPRFKIDLDFSKRSVVVGDRVAGEISAQYFFGKPVVRGKVTVRILDNRDVDRKMLDKLSFPLDDSGKANFQWRVPEDFIGEKHQQSELIFEVSVYDQADQKHQIQRLLPVSNTPIRIEFLAQSNKLVPGVVNEFFIVTQYPEGVPAQTKLTIEYPDSKVESTDLQTNEFGVASFRLNPDESQFPNDYEFKVQVHATDINGVKSSKEFELSRSFGRFEFLMQINRAVFRGGESANISCLGKHDGPIFIDVIRDSQTILTECVQMKNGRAELVIDLPPELSGTLQICAYRESDGGMMIRRNQLVHVQRASDLVVESSLDRDVYKPGDVAKLKLVLKNRDGNPEPGAVSLSIVDDAVFSVSSPMTGLQKAFFETDKELLRPIYELFPWSPIARKVNQGGYLEFERALFATAINRQTKVNQELLEFFEENFGTEDFEVLHHPEIEDLADQMGLSQSDLEILRGADTTHSLTGKSYPTKAHRYRQRLEYADRLFENGVKVGAFFLIVGLFLSLGVRTGSCGLILFPFFLLILIGLLMPAVQAAREAARRTQDANSLKNLSLGLDNAREAGISLNPNSASGEPSTRLRQWFPETLLWRPEVITGDDGIAEIEIPLADSITSWNVSAAGVTAKGIVGGHDSKIRVFQPFFVDVDLPVRLTRKDEFTVPIIVSNYSDIDQTVDLQIESDSWFEFVDQPKLSVTVKKDNVRRVAVTIKTTKVGLHSFVVQAQGHGMSDAVKRTIRVVPEGTPIHKVSNGVLDQPEIPVSIETPSDAVEQSSKATIKIYPGTFSQVAEGLESIFQLPSGCFEQTSSTVYPSVLALKYLRNTGRSVPEIEVKATRYINVGYQRLLTFEIPSGGFDWFGAPPASVEATAYGLMEFKDIAAVHNIDVALIDRTRRWLLDQQNKDGSWGRQKSIAKTAYVAWAVFENARQEGANKTREFLLSYPPSDINSPYELALICNALYAMKSDVSATPYLKKLLELKKESKDGKQAWWKNLQNSSTLFHGRSLSGNIETTALAALALIKSKSHSVEIRNSLRWILAQKDDLGNWHSTQATILALKALLAGSQNPVLEPKDRNIHLNVNGQRHSTIEIPKDQMEVMKQVTIYDLPKGTSTITINEDSASQSRFQLVHTYHVADAKNDDAPIGFELNYENASERNHLRVDAKISNNTNRDMPMLMIELPIPAGFDIRTSELQQLLDRNGIAKMEIKSQKVILYVRELKANDFIEFSYLLKANTSVKVAVPPARAYLYYSPDITGKSKSALLEFAIDESE